MNIRILDSWLREHLRTEASPKKIAELLSLSSVSVERLEKKGDDYLYDIEVTTNRPDLMSIVGLARETATVLSHNDLEATFVKPRLETPKVLEITEKVSITIKSNLTKRICAVVMEVSVKKSPDKIKSRLESSGIRSLNNLIDITNYVMRTIGHPTHVFDFDKIPTKTLNIRESRPKEEIKTLDGKKYILTGGDIVADDGLGNIIDLMGVMGLENSAVTDETKKILFFINNNDPHRIRKTSMRLGIRTEAAILNEKGIDPTLAMDALIHGAELFRDLAEGKIISEIIDIYPDKIKSNTISVKKEKIDQVIGVNIPLDTSAGILRDLGFETKTENGTLLTTPPTFRTQDVEIEEDIIEEIARIYGYHNIPNQLPAVSTQDISPLENNQFYFESHAKNALKYWGFNEVYTYPMVSENLYEGELDKAVTIQNPLNEEFVYMRKSLVPSLLKIVSENKTHEKISIFEIGNVYAKNGQELPLQTQRMAGVVRDKNLSFFKIKGLLENLLQDLGLVDISFSQATDGNGAILKFNNEIIGEIEILDEEIVDFELDFEKILEHATFKKTYKPISKFPPIVEDLSIIAEKNIATGDLMSTIEKQSPLVKEVSLLDKYEDTRTFHIRYQSDKRNLTVKEVGELRKKILVELKRKHNANIKE